MAGAASVESELAARIRRRGPVPFAEVVEVALYHPELGFYPSGGAAGRAGDFLTSPEVGPLFGQVVAHALDTWWRELGEPDRFTVVEAAAGSGTMARAVLASEPACRAALTYVLVERTATLRRRHRDHLPLVDAPFAFAPVDPERPPNDAEPSTAAVPARRASDRGPFVVSLAELPALAVRGVILANELLDNLPFALLERGADGWSEVFVGLADDDGTDELVEVMEPAAAGDVRVVDVLAPDAPVGARVPCQRAAAAWLTDALSRVEAGRVVVFDYGSTTAELAHRPVDEWLRTYRGHGRGGPALTDLGHQDITCEVAFDQLARVREPDRRQSQAAFLRSHGIEALVEEGRRIWEERAYLGDLTAVRGRSRVQEAAALVDPEGLGGFAVLEWIVS